MQQGITHCPGNHTEEPNFERYPPDLISVKYFSKWELMIMISSDSLNWRLKSEQRIFPPLADEWCQSLHIPIPIFAQSRTGLLQFKMRSVLTIKCIYPLLCMLNKSALTTLLHCIINALITNYFTLWTSLSPCLLIEWQEEDSVCHQHKQTWPPLIT